MFFRTENTMNKSSNLESIIRLTNNIVIAIVLGCFLICQTEISYADTANKKEYADTSLLEAADDGHIEIVKLLLKAGADPNQINDDGQTPLYRAIEYTRSAIKKLDRIEIVKLLLFYGANPNIASEYGTTPLIRAAEVGVIEIVKLLLDNNADPNHANDKGAVPLGWAAAKGHIEIVELLLNRGANPNVVNNKGGVPLHFAAENGHAEIVELLLNKNADPNIKSGYRENTPLILAVVQSKYYRSNPVRKEKYTKIVESLLEKRADQSIENRRGNSPLEIATKDGNTEIVKLLTDANNNLARAERQADNPTSIQTNKAQLMETKSKNAIVKLKTSEGDITIELNGEKHQLPLKIF